MSVCSSHCVHVYNFLDPFVFVNTSLCISVYCNIVCIHKYVFGTSVCMAACVFSLNRSEGKLSIPCSVEACGH